jgi:hypothetical protein
MQHKRRGISEIGERHVFRMVHDLKVVLLCKRTKYGY